MRVSRVLLLALLPALVGLAGCGRTPLDGLGSAARSDAEDGGPASDPDAGVRLDGGFAADVGAALDGGVDCRLRAELLGRVPMPSQAEGGPVATWPAGVVVNGGTRRERGAFLLRAGAAPLPLPPELEAVDADDAAALVLRPVGRSRELGLYRFSDGATEWLGALDTDAFWRRGRGRTLDALVGWVSGPNRVELRDRRSGVTTSLRAEGRPEWPTVRGRRALWIERADVLQRLVSFSADDADRGRQVVAELMVGQLTSPLLAGGRALFLADGALRSVGFGPRLPRVVFEGPCGAPAGDGERAVLACGGTSGDRFAGLGERIVVVDPDDSVRVLELGGAFALEPRVDGRTLAWIEYDAPDAICGGGPGLGRVVLVPDLERPERRQVVAPVGAPCLCCGAQWADPALVLGHGYVAWNFAEAPGERGFMGVEARVLSPLCD